MSVENARRLRRDMTSQEKKLWFQYLKNHKLHWYKQRPVGKYILDFYCGTLKIAIELDGSQHYYSDGIKYDTERTKFLNDNNILVLRYTNIDIDKNFEAVCMDIERVIRERII